VREAVLVLCILHGARRGPFKERSQPLAARQRPPHCCGKCVIDSAVIALEGFVVREAVLNLCILHGVVENIKFYVHPLAEGSVLLTVVASVPSIQQSSLWRGFVV